MIDAVIIKMTFVLTRSCVISGRRFTMMTCVHEIMRGQDGIIWISQNQNRTSTIILQCEHKGHVETNTKKNGHIFSNEVKNVTMVTMVCIYLVFSPFERDAC